MTCRHAFHAGNSADVLKHRVLIHRPGRLVATSLIEAGTDRDFRAGWRADCGAREHRAERGARVNREGKRSLEQSILTVFTSMLFRASLADGAMRVPPPGSPEIRR